MMFKKEKFIFIRASSLNAMKEELSTLYKIYHNAVTYLFINMYFRYKTYTEIN